MSTDYYRLTNAVSALASHNMDALIDECAGREARDVQEWLGDLTDRVGEIGWARKAGLSSETTAELLIGAAACAMLWAERFGEGRYGISPAILEAVRESLPGRLAVEGLSMMDNLPPTVRLALVCDELGAVGRFLVDFWKRDEPPFMLDLVGLGKLLVVLAGDLLAWAEILMREDPTS